MQATAAATQQVPSRSVPTRSERERSGRRGARILRSDSAVAAALTALRLPANRPLDELLVDLRDRDPAFRRSVHDAFVDGCTSLQWRAVPLHRKIDVFRVHYGVVSDDASVRRVVVTVLLHLARSCTYVDA